MFMLLKLYTYIKMLTIYDTTNISQGVQSAFDVDPSHHPCFESWLISRPLVMGPKNSENLSIQLATFVNNNNPAKAGWSQGLKVFGWHIHFRASKPIRQNLNEGISIFLVLEEYAPSSFQESIPKAKVPWKWSGTFNPHPGRFPLGFIFGKIQQPPKPMFISSWGCRYSRDGRGATYAPWS